MKRSARGMTVLELMIVLAILGGAAMLARNGFRALTKADLVESSTELQALMRSAERLAVSHAELHRVLIDLDKNVFVVEKCQGSTTIMRNEQVRVDADVKKRAMEKGKDRMIGLPQDAFAAGNPEENAKRVIALAGSHIDDKTCGPATDAISGDSHGRGWLRALPAQKGIKFKQVYVAHQQDPVTKGQVAIYFFPNASAEKAVVELTDGDAVFVVLVYGLSGRIELRDAPLHDINDHMMRNANGDKDMKREAEK